MEFQTPPSFTRHDLFGGRGAVQIWNLLGAAAPPFSAVLACELDPGGSVGAHHQERDPEIVIVTAGRGVARVGGDTHALAPGAMVYVPLGETLALQNDARDAPLRYLIIKARDPAPAR